MNCAVTGRPARDSTLASSCYDSTASTTCSLFRDAQRGAIEPKRRDGDMNVSGACSSRLHLGPEHQDWTQRQWDGYQPGPRPRLWLGTGSHKFTICELVDFSAPLLSIPFSCAFCCHRIPSVLLCAQKAPNPKTAKEGPQNPANRSVFIVD